MKNYECDPVELAIQCLGPEYEPKVILAASLIEGIADVLEKHAEAVPAIAAALHHISAYVTNKDTDNTRDNMDLLADMIIGLAKRDLDVSRRRNQALARAEEKELDRLIELFSSEE